MVSGRYIRKPFTEEHKKRLSISKLGIKNPNYGKHLSKETIIKIKTNAKENPYFGFKGRKHTEYTKKLIGLIHKGKKVNVSLNTRVKLSNSRKGIKLSAETKEKIRKFNIGKKLSKETKEKISKNHSKHFKGRHHTEEAKQKNRIAHSGKKSSLWNGGISFEPYTIDFNKRFKESIRKRDNYCCIVCNKAQEELSISLSIHHIDYNKLNSFPQNCVSLCNVCHSKTNCNRTQWKTFFQSLLKERYNYEYTQDQKIILDFTNGGD
jgi:hypothetical protein